jgi:hypothetical protein
MVADPVEVEVHAAGLPRQVWEGRLLTLLVEGAGRVERHLQQSHSATLFTCCPVPTHFVLLALLTALRKQHTGLTLLTPCR